ncbi:MAG TPA: alanyl-tRNA editing protein [Candidatus Polarisedimenticolaceae bacterium]|nr:alanyl-tRNA editing protein [Candidatus Polarisedimenticolaceae bacterium]
MADRKLFYVDPELSRCSARVVESGELDGRPFVRLDQTVFYPEGGGQPPDRGTIAGLPVVDVQSRGSDVLHLLGEPHPLEVGDEVEARIDAARRFDFRQQHTAQHLLTAILADRHRRPTTSFHLGDRFVAIEVDGEPPSPDRLARWEAEANALILEDRPVTTRWVAPETLADLPLRTRGLPKDHAGDVRLVEIEGIDLNTCGGTHVSRLGEIQALHVVRAERARGGSRITFVAGGRILSELRRAESVECALNARIGTSPEEFASVLDAWAAERKRAARKVKALEAQLATPLGEALAAEPGVLLARILPSGGPELLRAVANAVLGKRPEATVALLSSEEGCFLVQAGPTGPEDVSPLGTRLRAALGAKGGGKGRTFQGTGGAVPSGLDVNAVLSG